jgi:hypothetical protein
MMGCPSRGQPWPVEFVDSRKQGVGFWEFGVAATSEDEMIMGVVATKVT